MVEAKITFCNRAYGKSWYKNLKRQNPDHFQILEAIIEEICISEGFDISKNRIYERRPEIQKKTRAIKLDMVPSRGQMLKNNGNGIRHAKYSKSRSIAVIWEKIDNTIYITFDDHAPVAYHRAISHLREIRLYGKALPKRARNRGHFMRRLKIYRKNRWQRRFKGFDPKRKFYE